MGRSASRATSLALAIIALAAAASFSRAPTARADTSGPTGMGYDWTDSAPPAPVVPFRWFDISSTGSRLDQVSDCDDCAQEDVPIGFGFPFYGDSYGSLTVNANGALQFGDNVDHWGPGRLPTEDFSAPVILPFWSDWDAAASGDVYAQTVRDWPPAAGQAAFVVQWHNVENYDCDTGDNATWQAILVADGRIFFQYLDTGVGDLFCSRGADMTIGVQQGSQGCFVQYAHRTAAVTDGTAVGWSPSSCSPAGGTPTATPLLSPTATPGPGGAPDEVSGPPSVGAGPAAGHGGGAVPWPAAALVLAAGAGLVALGLRLRRT